MAQYALVTFLGGRKRGATSAGQGYEPVNYRFDDGGEVAAQYIGEALAQKLRPQRLCILGTASSMWDVLLEEMLPGNPGDSLGDELRMELMTAVDEGAVDQALLDRLAPRLGQQLQIGEVELRLIPRGREPAEQIEILQVIEAATKAADRVHLDVTHGFRHLSMLGFLSTFVIEQIQTVRVEALWYGALEMRNEGATPVIRLDGLLQIRDWVNALSRFDANGDYAVFAPLLERDGVAGSRTKLLREAAFLESVLNLSEAANRIRTFGDVLERPLSGPSALFQRSLQKRLRWSKAKEPALQQQALARAALERRDYLRAALFGWESLVTQQAWLEQVDHTSYKEREEIGKRLRKAFQDDGSGAGQRQSEAHSALNALRNSLAHGTAPHPKSSIRMPNEASPWKLREVLKDEGRLMQVMRHCLDCLFEGG